MLVADKILISLYTANKYSCTLCDQIASQELIGEDVCKLEWQYILLGQWIRVLQKFYDNNFDESGEIITPAYQTITLEQAEELMSKLKLAIGNNRYPIPNIFTLGMWIESLNFYWNDSDGDWTDIPPLN